MSEPEWHAVLVGAETIIVWPMAGGAALDGKVIRPRADLAQLDGPVVAAGLAGQTRPVPAKPDLSTAHVQDLPHCAAIPMLGQAHPAALSNGAETAIGGYLARNPAFDGVLLILGDQTCWAHVSAEEVVSFQTFLTPRLGRALGAEAPPPGDAFTAALQDTLSRPERLAQHLASAEAGETGQAMAHLIGAEIAAAKPYWLGQAVVVLGEGAMADAYLHALALQGATAEAQNLDTAYLAGFAVAWSLITDPGSAQ